MSDTRGMTDVMTRPVPGLPQWHTGDRLAKARQWAGLDQAELAALLDLNRRTLSRWENNPTPPRLAIMAYAEVTGVPAWWIEGRDPRPNEATVTHQKRALVTALPWPIAA